MIKVLLVDDHELVREGVKKILSDLTGIKVLGEAASGEEAVQISRNNFPDVILMDVKMPGIGGLEATRKLLRLNPDAKILVLTALDDEPFPSRMLQAGALGYITKGCDSKEMERAIRAVNSGQRYISSTIAQQLALKHVGEVDDSPFDELSERELQVTLMITGGQKVADISKKLCLSPKTVNSYRYRIFEKLKVHSDVELTHLAIRHEIIDAGSIDS